MRHPDVLEDADDVSGQWGAMAQHAPRRVDRDSPLPPLQPTPDPLLPVVPTLAVLTCLSICGIALAIAQAASAL